MAKAKRTSKEQDRETRYSAPSSAMRALNFVKSLDGMFEGTNSAGAAADALRRQDELHLQFVTTVSRWMRQGLNGQRFADSFQHAASAYVKRVVESAGFSVQQASGGHRVASPLLVPSFRDSDLVRLSDSFDPKAGIEDMDAAMAMMAAYAYSCRAIPVQVPFLNDTVLGGPYGIAASVHAATVAMTLPNPFEANINAAKHDLVEINKISSWTKDAVREQVTQLRALDQRYGAFQEQLEKAKEHQTTALEDMKAAQLATLQSIREDLRLNEARKLWGTRARWSAAAFYFSSIVLIFAMLAIPLIAWYYRADIISFLKEYEAAIVAGATSSSEFAATVSAIGRLLLITAPLGFVIWLLRLGVRFNMRSMLLMDDARQRVSMLDTYLFLIEKDAAVKQDRGAILEALFRRPPGHGPDTAEPPHFTELLKFGQDTAPKS